MNISDNRRPCVLNPEVLADMLLLCWIQHCFERRFLIASSLSVNFQLEVGLHCNNLLIICGDLVVGLFTVWLCLFSPVEGHEEKWQEVALDSNFQRLSRNSFRDKAGCQAVNMEKTAFFMWNCFSWPGSQKSKLFGSPLGGKSPALGRQGPLFSKLNRCTGLAFGGTEDTKISSEPH